MKMTIETMIVEVVLLHEEGCLLKNGTIEIKKPYPLFAREDRVTIVFDERTHECCNRPSASEILLLESLLMETHLYDNNRDIEMFAREIGRNNELEKVFADYKQTSETMHNIFTPSELEMLYRLTNLI